MYCFACLIVYPWMYARLPVHSVNCCSPVLHSSLALQVDNEKNTRAAPQNKREDELVGFQNYATHCCGSVVKCISLKYVCIMKLQMCNMFIFVATILAHGNSLLLVLSHASSAEYVVLIAVTLHIYHALTLNSSDSGRWTFSGHVRENFFYSSWWYTLWERCSEHEDTKVFCNSIWNEWYDKHTYMSLNNQYFTFL